MRRNQNAITQLRAVPLFSACTDKELALIAQATTRLSFAAGHVLAREGERGHEFLVIVDGKARVTIGAQEIATLGAGDFFGEISLLDGGDRTATVTAETDLVAEVIGQREFGAVLEQSPRLAHNLLTGLARRTLPTATAVAVGGPDHLDGLLTAVAEGRAALDAGHAPGEHLHVSERLVAPPLCDPSTVRLKAGYLTASDLIDATRSYRVRLVAPTTGLFAQVPQYERWLSREYWPARGPNGVTVYVRR